MKNATYYPFEEFGFGSRLINFLVAVFSNGLAAFYICLPILALFLLFIDDLLFKLFGFRYGFLICAAVFLILWSAFNLCYIFSKKGVYITNDRRIIINNGFFANCKFYNFNRFKYSFGVLYIKKADIGYKSFSMNAWEIERFIPNKSDFVVIELVNGRRVAFALEDNFEFVEEIEKIKTQGQIKD